MQQSIAPSMRTRCAGRSSVTCCCSSPLTLMRLRNLILFQERQRPWVAGLVNKERQS